MRFAINFVTANGTTIDGTLYPANGTYTIQSSVSGNMVVNYDANKVGGYWAQAECFENTTGGFYPNAGTVIVETGGDGKPYITFNSTSTILAPTSNKTTNTYKFHIGTPPSSSHDVTITNGNSTYGTLTGTTLMTVDDGSSISITNSGKTLTIDGQSVTATPNDSTAQYIYTFTGWTNATGTITASREITANFSCRYSRHLITFRNDNGTVLQSSYVDYGTTPTYSGTPTKEATESTEYTFNGWNTTPVAVTGPATYTATYSSSTRQYAVNYDTPDNGSISVLKDKTTISSGSNVDYNSNLTITATPANSDYVLQSLTVNGIAFTSGETYTVTGATNISATFRRISYDELTLLDDESADYYNSFASRYNGAKVDEVTYERTFIVGRWSTVCLPFTVAVEEIDPVWEQVYEFVRATGDANTTGDGMMLYFRKATTLLAGKCYLVYNTGVSDISSTTFTDVTINTTADKADITSLEGYKDEGDISLVGTLRKGTLPHNNHTYMALSNNTIYWPGNNGITVRAYRSFFKDANPTPTNTPQRVRIVVEGEVATDLEIMENGELRMENDNVRKYMDNGVLIIERNGIRYDAQGKRIEN